MKRTVVLFLGIVTILAGLVAVAPRATAVPSATSIGGIDNGFGFLSEFFLQQCGVSLPFTASLLRDGVTLQSFNQVCSGSFFGFIFSGTDVLAQGDRGIWTLRLTDSLGGVLHFHSWVLPSLQLTATSNPGQANTGDSIWVSTVFSLPKSGGADFYIATGYITVKAGADTVSIVVETPAVDIFVGNRFVSDHPFITGRPVAFGTAGAKTINVAWNDGFEEISTSVGVTVVSPLESTLNSIDQRLARLETSGATKQDIAALQGDLTALRTTVSANDTAAQKAISDLQNRLDTLKLRAERAQSDLTVARSDLSTAQLVSYVAVVLGIAGIIAGVVRRRPKAPAASGP